jgi:hypothetical protein
MRVTARRLLDRLGVPRASDDEMAKRRRLHALRKWPSHCYLCDTELAADDEVWRIRVKGRLMFGWSSVVVPICRPCAEHSHRIRTRG